MALLAYKRINNGTRTMLGAFNDDGGEAQNYLLTLSGWEVTFTPPASRLVLVHMLVPFRLGTSGEVPEVTMTIHDYQASGARPPEDFHNVHPAVHTAGKPSGRGVFEATFHVLTRTTSSTRFLFGVSPQADANNGEAIITGKYRDGGPAKFGADYGDAVCEVYSA